MTTRKRWPNEAENSRMESIAAARNGLQAARKVAKGQVEGLVEVIDQFHKIIENLMAVGPRAEIASQSLAMT